jgi:hypothetical protein
MAMAATDKQGAIRGACWTLITPGTSCGDLQKAEGRAAEKAAVWHVMPETRICRKV